MDRTRRTEEKIPERERKQIVTDSDIFYNVKLLLGKRTFRKIEKTTIVLIGLGGIGSNLILALAGIGFRSFILIDGDVVSRRNIPLSNAFSLKHVGSPKVLAAAATLREKYGRRIRLKCYPHYSDRVPSDVLTGPDMLVLGVDDRWTKLAITNLRVKANKPYVHLGFLGWEASYMLTMPGVTACWACLFRPNEKEKVERLKREGKCPEPDPNMPGAVTSGTIQRIIGFAANEIMKFLAGKADLVQYYSFDASTNDELTRFLGSTHFKPDPECPFCSKEDEIDVANIQRERRQ